MRRLFSFVCAAAVMSLAGCHTCDVCDDCGDGYGCGCGNNTQFHSRNYGDPGYAPGYQTPAFEGTVSSSAKRIPMQPITAAPKALPAAPKMQAASPVSERVIR